MIENLNSIEKPELIRMLEGLTNRLSDLETRVLLNKKQLSAPLTWVAPTYQNSWVNFGGGYENGAYAIDALGFVILRGVVKNGTVPAAMFTLPAGFRPAGDKVFPSIASDEETVLEVLSNGEVIIDYGPNTYVILEGIRFYADQ